MTKERIVWMDMMRGSLILLVIIQHWISDFNLYNDLSESFIYNGIYQVKIFFAPYRMELLFFLSGFIVHKSINKNFIMYLKGKINNLLYPYILWSLVFLTLYNFSSLLSGEYLQTLHYLQRIVIGATNLTWFLYFLFLYFVTSLIIIRKKINTAYILISTVALCYLFSNINIYDRVGVEYLEEGDIFYYFIFFYLGCYCGVKQYDIQNLSNNPLALFIALLCVIATAIINFHTNIQKTSLLYLIPVILSIPLAIFLATQIEKVKAIKRTLTHISLNSIVYYLMHLVLLRVFTKIFDVSHFNQNSAFPIKLVLTLLTIYLFILLKRKFSLLDILFQPPHRRLTDKINVT
ncbi:acyltransferase family protein [Klebsiella sp. 10]|uniref:acyltransferase family protein n=1 Tax=Klebsiella sp. 10 TaxID=2822434 RepID=UPI001BAB31FA|nr:acyltransferase [Klebsiella sp. 10]